MILGMLERWDRRNQRILEAHNDRAKTQPLVTPGALQVIFADVTLNVAWMCFLIGTILILEGSVWTKVVGGAFYLGAVAALVIGGRRVVEKLGKARRNRRQVRR